MRDLKKEMQFWRCERPSEYKMDDFMRGVDKLEAENKNLNKIKSNWESLKDLLYLTIDNYGDDEDIDTSVAEQILDEMNKLEANK